MGKMGERGETASTVADWRARVGAYEQAVDGYREAIAQRPEDPSLYRAIGIAYAKLGQYEAAVHSFQRALELHGADSSSEFGLGQALFHLGRSKESQAAYRRAIEIDPAQIKAHASLGFLLDDDGKSDEAPVQYAIVERAYEDQATTDLRGDDPDRYADFGRVLMALKRRDEATRSYERAVALYRGREGATPPDPDVYAGLAFTLDDLGRHEEAADAYRRAIQLRPNDWVAVFDIGVVLERLGDFDHAVDAYRRAGDILPNSSDVFAALGSALAKAGRCEEAAVECRKSIAIRKDNPDAWSALGIALGGQEQYRQAEAAYTKSLALNRDDETAQHYAKLLIDQDRPEDAENVIAQQLAVETTWRIAALRAAIDAALGDKYQANSYYTDCVDHVTEALKLAPSNPSEADRSDIARLYYQRGSAHMMLTDYGKAKADFRKCRDNADQNSTEALSAIRTIRRINSRVNRRLDVPGWLSYVVSVLAIAGIAYGGWLVERKMLSGTEYFPLVLGLILVIFAAFSLPSITTLKLGPAEFDKQVVTVAIAPPDKLK